MHADLQKLLHDAERLTADDGSAGGESDSALRLRISRSVVRPLRVVVQHEPGANGSSAKGASTPGSLERGVVQLAQRATRLRAKNGAPAELVEATAALQDAAINVAPDSLGTLAALQAKLAPAISPQPDGPYLVTNAPRLVDWLGVELPLRPQLALCRCGASKLKPLCDGSHAEIGFTDEKDPHRVADHVNRYDGQQISVLDNRGTCAHSGLCTSRLATVFHADADPFVTPAGGRMDEIMRAVRTCPSGALSYAIDGREAREQVDQLREQAIEVSKDGPYRITGGIPLLEADGTAVARNEGASLEHYSLCRCGHSQNKPFCSGMHWYVGFADPPPPSGREPTLFEWAGGFPALTRMTRLFYERYVPEDPLLAPLFANMAPDHPERVAAWLGEVFGGPKAYSERYGGYNRMVSQHLGRNLREEQRARWVELLCRSADDAGLPADAEFRAAFVGYIEWGSRIARENSTSGATPPMNMPVPHWWWVCNAYPDARRSALAPQADKDEARVSLPAPSEAVSYAAHIKPLFREGDRRSMLFAFDLWSYDDVSKHAAAILARLEQGTMPCDGAWPGDQIDVFRRWTAAGTPG